MHLPIPTRGTQKSLLVLTTLDTKGEEAGFVAEWIRRTGSKVEVVDISLRGEPRLPPDRTREEVLEGSGLSAQELAAITDRHHAASTMALALTRYLEKRVALGEVGGILGLGGSTGTSILAPAWNPLPLGLPKVLVSTLTGLVPIPDLEGRDVVYFQPVTDLAGLNGVASHILIQASATLVALAEIPKQPSRKPPAIGLTMFGVTTPCVDAVRAQLEHSGYEALVFHSTGAGGRSMERLVEENRIHWIADITPTDVADEIAGGIFACGPNRFRAQVDKGLPILLCPGGLDMVNFGPMDTVPQRYRHRLLRPHNSHVTLMRTLAEEMERCANFILKEINRSQGPITILLPEGGLSSLDKEGGPFWNPEVNAILFHALEKGFQSVVMS
jgi:uncharacterized protein (UPF0261 family)